jgi:hypothetical protein
MVYTGNYLIDSGIKKQNMSYASVPQLFPSTQTEEKIKAMVAQENQNWDKPVEQKKVSQQEFFD